MTIINYSGFTDEQIKQFEKVLADKIVLPEPTIKLTDDIKTRALEMLSLVKEAKLLTKEVKLAKKALQERIKIMSLGNNLSNIDESMAFIKTPEVQALIKEFETFHNAYSARFKDIKESVSKHEATILDAMRANNVTAVVNSHGEIVIKLHPGDQLGVFGKELKRKGI